MSLQKNMFFTSRILRQLKSRRCKPLRPFFFFFFVINLEALRELETGQFFFFLKRPCKTKKQTLILKTIKLSSYFQVKICKRFIFQLAEKKKKKDQFLLGEILPIRDGGYYSKLCQPNIAQNGD
jgi:hypothetical protein